MRKVFLLPLCLALLLLPRPASAHKVNIFAYVENGRIYTESGYSKTSRVHHGQVEAFDPETNELLFSGTTDDEGNLDFPIPPKALERGKGLLLILKAGEGHQGQWTVTAEELGGAVPEESHEAPDTDPGPVEILIGLAAIAVFFGGLALLRRKGARA